ncbi:XRE family transcriptional regulator [Burkholderia sp. Ac-20349]
MHGPSLDHCLRRGPASDCRCASPSARSLTTPPNALEDVATASGLSKGYMSQVERGHASPSLSALTRIATALGVAIDYFFTPSGNDLSISHAESRTFFSTSESPSCFSHLTGYRGHGEMEAVLIRTPPGARCIESPLSAEQLIYVLKGEIKLTLDGNEFPLREGDFVQYKTKAPHSVENVAQAETTLLWIGTP